MLRVWSSTEKRRVCFHFERRVFFFENCQICSGEPTHCGILLSQLLHCSDGCSSVTLVVEFASLVFQDDILLPLCPVETEKFILCLHVDKSVHTQGHAPILLLSQQHWACPSPWSRAPSSRGRLQKKCLLLRGSTRSPQGAPSPMYPQSN